jgi:hypothetical protein
MTAGHDQEIACQQVLLDDSSVFSVQWTLIPASLASGLTPEIVLQRYLAYIRRTTLSLITPVSVPADTGIRFLLFASRKLPLISFLPALQEGSELVIRICGGLLVQRRQCHRGELRFGVEHTAEGVKVSLQLSDYCPLILGSDTPSVVRRWLYRITQAAIHKLVTVRFLAMLYQELAGSKALVRVVPVHVRHGSRL